MMLLRRLIPALPWVVWAPTTGLVLALAYVIADLRSDFPSRNLYLRVALLVVALGFSFAIDDPASVTAESTPSPLWKRRIYRLLLFAAPWLMLVGLVLWSGTIGGVEPALSPSANWVVELPVGRLLIEGAAMAAIGLAIAAVIALRKEYEPGKYASLALLGLYIFSWATPEQWRPWRLPSDTHWNLSQTMWWGALLIGAAVFLLASLDAGRILIQSEDRDAV